MMNVMLNRLAVSLALLAAVPAMSSAQTFQMEAGVVVGKGEVGSVDYNTLAARGRYYLRAVPIGDEPFSEAPFIDKAAHVELGYLKLDPDQGNAFDTLGIEGHFVTQQNYIFEASVDRNDAGGNGGSSTDLEVGIGKYLDARSAAILTLELEDDAADTKTLGVSKRHLSDGTSPGTWWAYDIGAALISADDTGFQLEASGTYYLSQQLGVTAGIDLTKIDNGDTTEVELTGEYFINELMAGSLTYLTSSGDGPDNKSILLTARVRF